MSTKEDKQIRIAVRLTPKLKDEFMTYCKDNSINSSDVVRKLISKWLEDEKAKQK